MNSTELKTEIRQCNELLRTTHNPYEYKQTKARLKRLERKLRQYEK